MSCNSANNQVERKGVINMNPNPEYQQQYHQMQKASEQNRGNNNNYNNNNTALKMYALVNRCAGNEDRYNNIRSELVQTSKI
jgi:hypothetical protein